MIYEKTMSRQILIKKTPKVNLYWYGKTVWTTYEKTLGWPLLGGWPCIQDREIPPQVDFISLFIKSTSQLGLAYERHKNVYASLTFYIKHSINFLSCVHFHNSVSMVTWHSTWWRHSISPLHHVIVIALMDTDVSCDDSISSSHPGCFSHQKVSLVSLCLTLPSLHVPPVPCTISTSSFDCCKYGVLPLN